MAYYWKRRSDIMITKSILLLNKTRNIHSSCTCVFRFIYKFYLPLNPLNYGANRSNNVINITPWIESRKNRNESLEIHQGLKNVQPFAFSKGSNNRIISICDTYLRVFLSNWYRVSDKVNLKASHLIHQVLYSSWNCVRT